MESQHQPLTPTERARLAALRGYYTYEGPPIRIAKLESGGTLLQIHYSADPSKDNDRWVVDNSAAVTPEKWAQEMELLRASTSGDRVIRTFNRRIHLPPSIADDPPVYPGSVFIAGWDTGSQTLHPAFYLLQVTKVGQIIGMGEVDGSVGMTIPEFAPEVQRWMMDFYPSVWQVFHLADPACRAKSGNDGRNARQVLYEDFGIPVYPATNVLSVRLGAVNRAFTDYISEEALTNFEFENEVDGGDEEDYEPLKMRVVPRIVISSNRSQKLIQGFDGKYRFTPLPKGKTTDDPDVRERSRPIKNKWSNVQDAFQYAVIGAWRLIDEMRRNPYFSLDDLAGEQW